MAYKIFKSSDTSAPSPELTASNQDSNIRTNLVSILDKCLVDGYGSTTSAGWTKPSAGGNLVYQSPNGQCLQVLPVDFYSLNVSVYSVPLIMYNNLTDASTTRISQGYSYISSTGSGVGSSQHRFGGTFNWIVGASSDSVFIYASPSISTNHVDAYFTWLGKITNTESSQTGYAQFGGSAPYTSYPIINSIKSLYRIFNSMQYSLNNSAWNQAVLLFGPMSSTNTPSSPISGYGSNIASENKLRYAPIKILDYSTSFYKGDCEGLITLEHGSGGLNHLDTITVNSKNYLVIGFRGHTSESLSSYTANYQKSFILVEI